MRTLRPIKSCHVCRASYTIETWEKLEIDHSEGQSGMIQTRKCGCGELLVLDLRGVYTVEGAMPEPEPEHTASRAEPPPAALGDDPHTCPHDWGYRMESATLVVLHVPLVPYPKPIIRANPATKARSMIELLLQARGLLDLFIGELASKLPADGGGSPPGGEPKDAAP